MRFCFVLVPVEKFDLKGFFWDLYKFVDLLIKSIQVSYTA